MSEVWPAILVTGVSFAVPQFLISNFVGPWMVDIGASLVSMGCLIGFLRSGSPRRSGCRRRCAAATTRRAPMPAEPAAPAEQVTTAPKCAPRLTPWIIVCVVLLSGASGWFKVLVNQIFILNYPVAGLHNMISKVPPVVAKPTPKARSSPSTGSPSTGTGMLIAAIICRPHHGLLARPG